MAKYRKKPVEVEAVQIETYLDLPAVAAWVNANGGSMGYGQSDDGPAYGLVDTLEGQFLRADIRDWIIRGVAGEFYPCKPSIFAATYEPVDDAGGAK